MNSLSRYNSSAQIHSYASSNESARCKGSSGKRKGKIQKIPAWQLTKVRNKKEVIAEARNEGKKVHFSSSTDLCHLKNSQLEPQFQKYKGRVVLRGDIVKDDSVSYAGCTEQGSSASKMTSLKVMDIISRLPGCAAQAADAVSAYTQVQNGRCTDVIKKSKVRMSRFVDTSTKTQMAKIMVQYGRPSHSLIAKFVRSSFGRTIVKGNSRKFS